MKMTNYKSIRRHRNDQTVSDTCTHKMRNVETNCVTLKPNLPVFAILFNNSILNAVSQQSLKVSRADCYNCCIET